MGKAFGANVLVSERRVGDVGDVVKEKGDVKGRDGWSMALDMVGEEADGEMRLLRGGRDVGRVGDTRGVSSF
jgi:hypothetical protein